jgi:tetratricopeptide (TPR) repeat protein
MMKKIMTFLKIPWIIINLVFLHIGYIFLGIDQEYFYINRGNYFYKLGCYSLALGNFKTALGKYDSKDKFLKPSIGYCYTILGNYTEALEIYREAYSDSKHPDILVGLLCAELNCGNDNRGVQVFEELLTKEKEFDDWHRGEVIRIKKKMIQDGIIEEEKFV